MAECPGRGTPARETTVARRARVALLALAVPALVGLMAQAAIAQPPRPGAVPPRTRTAPRAAAPKATAAADAGATAASPPPALTGAPGAAPTAGATAPADAGAGVVEAKTLDGGTHVFKFKELDIEGRLKSPQLVYFLRRVRAEFSAGDLGHRTFMREMSETRKEPSF
jgi:hypothetical protein